MKTLSASSARFVKNDMRATWLDRLARRIVLGRLGALEKGKITLIEDGCEQTFGRTTESFPVAVDVIVKHPAFFSDIAFGGSVGSGEAYIQGYWECSELETLVQILLRNRSVLDELDSGWALVTAPVKRLFHWMNKNTRKGSRRKGSRR